MSSRWNLHRELFPWQIYSFLKGCLLYHDYFKNPNLFSLPQCFCCQQALPSIHREVLEGSCHCERPLCCQLLIDIFWTIKNIVLSEFKKPVSFIVVHCSDKLII